MELFFFYLGCNFTVTEQDSNRIQYEGRNYRNSNGFVSSFRVRRSTYCDWNIIAPPNKIVILKYIYSYPKVI